MAFEPIKLVESLTKGVVEAVYDLARLSAAGFVMPFVSRTRRFWPWLISVTARIPPLTYLFIWILICVTTLSESFGRKFVASAVGLEKSSDTTVATIVAITLLTTIVLDVPLRLAFSRCASEARRKLYVAIGHLALGHLFLGAFLILVLTPNYHGLVEIAWPTPVRILSQLYFILVPMPLIFLFSPPLVVVIAKALPIAGRWLLRLTIGLALTYVVIFAAANMMLHTAVQTSNLVSWINPKVAVEVRQRDTQCDAGTTGIRISGFLTVTGPAGYPLHAKALGIRYARAGRDFTGKVRDGQPGILLSSASYVWVDLAGDRDPGDPEPAAELPRNCQFVLLENVSERGTKVGEPKDDKP